MARLSLKEIEERVEDLAERIKEGELEGREIIFELLLAYGKPRSSISRLRNGSLSVAEDSEHEVAQKGVFWWRELPATATEQDLLAVGEELRTAAHVLRYTPRFIVVASPAMLLAWDTKTGENIVFPLVEVAQHFAFFLPWAGLEKTHFVADTHADIKAAERMGELFDELLSANPQVVADDDARHGLNVFFTRLLFCFFAEDTGIFTPNQFTNAVGSHTLDDGSDTRAFLTDLFAALDTQDPADKPSYLADFPYVNGRLFSSDQKLTVPEFGRQARSLLLGLGSLLWQEINPDIFGSMFQAIVTPDQRSDLGQHYTSVPNILKTVEPLFLEELRAEFDAAYDKPARLEKLLARLAEIRVFDPACGSGNFLVIAYKELRRLEHAVLERLAELDPAHNTLFTDSVISIEHFYGIEIDDFAAQVAILSLWIAKHQMNREFRDKFGAEIPLIPLRETGAIHAGNATRIDWRQICPNDGGQEVYLIGNPPYKGGKSQPPEMKADYPFVFTEGKIPKDLDYIGLWFILGARYISGTRAKLAFVSTNSVVQGDHVGLMFPRLFELGVEISYAYTSFRWENNAKNNAGVTVIVLSLRPVSDAPKYLYQADRRDAVSNISPYLIEASDVIVTGRRPALSPVFPPMTLGSMPRDGGGLIMEPSEREGLALSEEEEALFLKRYMGAAEFINGKDRYCLWIEDENAEQAASIPGIARRLERVRESRLASTASSTAGFAEYPHRFVQRAYKPTDSIIVPAISSERREYVPIGYLGPDTVISNKGFAVYDAEPWLFALLTSRMHMVWLRTVGGRLEERLSYANTIVYNTFPVPPLTDGQKFLLTEKALRVLDVREYHYEHTLAELYDPEDMPTDLRQAHAELDAAVDSLYLGRRTQPFASDDERLATLFALYEQMSAEEVQAQEAAPRR